MNTIELIQNFAGDRLTPDFAQRIAHGDHVQLQGLYDTVVPFYDNWLDYDIDKRPQDDRTIHHVISRVDHESLTAAQWTAPLRQQLLYFDTVTIPDPLAEVIWPAALMIKLLGSAPLPDDFQDNVQHALEKLAALAEWENRKEFVLFPKTFVADLPRMQHAARDEIATVTDEQLNALTAKLSECAPGDFTPEGTRIVLGEVSLWGHFCAELDFVPVASNPWSRTMLRERFLPSHREARRERASRAEQRAEEAIVQFDLPGLADISLSEILKLRDNEEAFHELRQALRQVLDQAMSAGPADQEQFNAEFRVAAQDRIGEKLEKVKQAVRGSSVLQDVFVPSALGLGVGMFNYTFLGGTLEPALVGLGISPTSWVFKKLLKRYGSEGRKAALLRQFYCHLLEKQPP